jgi:methanogenic corrinoid protein MtbC1
MKIIKHELTRDPRLELLSELLAELKEDETLSLIEKARSEGFSSGILLESCMEGMRRVGKSFEEGRYFIAALIMAGEIMRRAMEMLGPRLSPEESGKTRGRVLIGTVQGDIHDLGKNLFGSLLGFDGVEVVDLGVDVEPGSFLAKAREVSPSMIGLSCVLTSCVSELKDTVAVLQKGLSDACPPIIIGGACIDETTRAFTNADFWAADAYQGLTMYREIIKKALKSSGPVKQARCFLEKGAVNEPGK